MSERSAICVSPNCQQPAVFWVGDVALCSVCREPTSTADMERPQRYAPLGYGARARKHVLRIMAAREQGEMRPLAGEAIGALHREFGCPSGCDEPHGGDHE